MPAVSPVGLARTCNVVPAVPKVAVPDDGVIESQDPPFTVEAAAEKLAVPDPLKTLNVCAGEAGPFCAALNVRPVCDVKRPSAITVNGMGGLAIGPEKTTIECGPPASCGIWML